MDDRRQKNQEQLALPFAGGSEACLSDTEGIEASRARRETGSPAGNQRMMEAIWERENRREALKRVRGNQGSPGIDGMTVEELPEYLEQHWPAMREQLLNGTYEPQPVKRVEIPKPDGGVRKLGILARGEEAWITLSGDKEASWSSLQGRCWIGLSSRRYNRYYKNSGTRRFPNTATVFDRDGRPSRR